MRLVSVEEWNNAGNYWEQFHALNQQYYITCMTAGGHDDLEAFKRLFDHCSCKIRHKKNKVDMEKKYVSEYVKYCEETGKDINYYEWFLLKIDELEAIFTEAYKKKSNEATIKTVATLETEGKKKLRLLHRELMLILQILNAFDIEKKFKPKEDLTKDLG